MFKFNYREYVEYLKENELVESVDSVQHVLNATEYATNLKMLEKESFEFQETEINKDIEISNAVQSCYSLDFATGIFGNMNEYYKYLDMWRTTLKLSKDK